MIGIMSEDMGLIRSIFSYTSEMIHIKSVDYKLNTPLTGLFIDWSITENRVKPSDRFVFQGALVSHYSKKNVPIAIYDRYMFIDKNENEWLNKFNNIHLIEPALNNRRNFSHLPHWIDTDENRLLSYSNNRDIDIAFVNNDEISPSFEKYCMDYIKKYNKRNVVYKEGFDDWENTKFTVCIGNTFSYNTGYMNDFVSKALSNGCMVLCPIEHKYYIGLFYGYTVNSIDDIEYFINMGGSEDVRLSSVLSIYNRINKDYTEFTLDFTTKKIMEYMDVKHNKKG